MSDILLFFSPLKKKSQHTLNQSCRNNFTKNLHNYRKQKLALCLQSAAKNTQFSVNSITDTLLLLLQDHVLIL